MVTRGGGRAEGRAVTPTRVRELECAQSPIRATTGSPTGNIELDTVT
eukprot:gene10915-2656_t